MVNLRHSQLDELVASDRFLWCTGIEDTFITAPSAKTGRTLDEYQLTGHYERWPADIDLISSLGVSAARYGIPWHLINPERGKWVWDTADGPIERLLANGVTPIIDLVHYGLPDWIEGAFLNPQYPELVAEYASRVAERFKGRVYAYTPLNEPRITAWYCGRIGWWPPYLKSWPGFVAVMKAVCRGIVMTVEALRRVDPDMLIAHVDATDTYRAENPDLETDARHRQEIVFLALDLISGRVVPGHSLHEWVRRCGVSDNELSWFQDHAVDLPLIGLNLYPMFTQKTLSKTPAGRRRIRMDYAQGHLVEEVGQLYWNRYGVPLFIAETASSGSIRRRADWMNASITAVSRLRARGVPLIGYTWWPLFSLVTWTYRQGNNPPEYYFNPMGLWSLDANCDRVETPLVTQYRHYVAGDAKDVGRVSHIATEAALQPR
jgi:beta-glucosidase